MGIDLPEIIKRAQQGSKSAFGILYKEYYQKIYRYCRINIYREDAAEDICQETFIRAWKSLPRFKITQDGTFQAYLFRIARNLIIDLGRKRKEYSLDEYREIETEDNHAEALDKELEALKVKQALAKLEEKDRQIILLRFFEELSHADVAKIIGMKEGALRVRTGRLLQKMKGILAHE